MRSFCGLATSSKAAKKTRRISAFNVYQQTRMKGKSVRVGTPAYNELLQRVKLEWREMSEERRATFAAQAHTQNLARAMAAKQTLRDIEGTEAAASEVLSPAQRKRLGQKQLNQSLQALATHPVWDTGLGISDHVAALKSSLVQSVDPESAAISLRLSAACRAEPS